MDFAMNEPQLILNSFLKFWGKMEKNDFRENKLTFYFSLRHDN